jgi:hypothetical protein
LPDKIGNSCMEAVTALKRRIRMMLLQRILPRPFISRHVEYTIIASLDDEPAVPTPRLIDLALKSIAIAPTIDLSSVSARLKDTQLFPDIWPGEHYKLLAGLVEALQPKLVVEVGTYMGMSALSILQTLPESSRLVTYDIVGLSDLPSSLVKEDDFDDGRLEQKVEDLSDSAVFGRNTEIMRDADIIFIDGPHNVTFEDDLLAKLKTIQFRTRPIFILDDIRLLGMTGVWRRIDRPKLDLTSFGHWSGTGIVDWSA